MSDAISQLPIAQLDAALHKVVGSSTRAAARVHQQPAYIIHSTPHSETSLLLDVFTRDYGRLAVLAKGARRPYTRWRASLFQTFQMLSIAYTGRGQVRTLTDIDWVGGIMMVQGAALMAAYYMNEWLRRTQMNGVAAPALFDVYQTCLAQLSLTEDVHVHAAILRGFELGLLRELGCAPSWQDAPDGEGYAWDGQEHRWVAPLPVRMPYQFDVSADCVGYLRDAQTRLDAGAHRGSAVFVAPESAPLAQEAKAILQAVLAFYTSAGRAGSPPLFTRQIAEQIGQIVRQSEREPPQEHT